MPDADPTVDPTADPSALPEVYGEKRRRRTVLKVMLASLLTVGLITGVVTVLAYRQLDSNLTVSTPLIVAPRPDKVYVDAPHQPVNILIMGSDSRDCAGCHIDAETPGGSDTTLFLHLSADRKSAYVVSVPRDLMVDRPECESKDGTDYAAASYVQWNAAFSLAGPGCTISQFEALSGIRVDDSIVVDFGSFKGMVDAIGGVEVCIPEEIDDPDAHITLPAGTRTISGDEALSYVRVRYGVGDNSDLGRIKRQQAFIASMVHSVFSANTLTNPWKVYKFLKAATGGLEVSPGLSHLTDLARLGYGFRGIGLDKIQFLTIPIGADPNDSNRVVESTAAADAIWQRLNNDERLTKDDTASAIKAGSVPGQVKHPGKSDAAQEQQAALAGAGLCT